MREQYAPRVFEITFRTRPRLRDVVRAAPHLPLPPLPPIALPQPPAAPDPDRIVREERQAIQQVLAQLRSAADQLGARREGLLAEMRQGAIELATAIAGRLLFDKLKAGEFPVEEMVRQALARLPAAPAVTVYLHPDDLALLRRRLADEPLLPTREPEVRVEADRSLPRGGCRAEAGEIHVLSELAGQLAELRRHLLWSASHARSGSGSTTPGPGPAVS